MANNWVNPQDFARRTLEIIDENIKDIKNPKEREKTKQLLTEAVSVWLGFDQVKAAEGSK